MAAFVALLTHCAVLTSPLGSEGAASAGADADGACFAMKPEKLAKLKGKVLFTTYATDLLNNKGEDRHQMQYFFDTTKSI